MRNTRDTVAYEYRKTCIYCGAVSVTYREMDAEEWCKWSDEDPDNVYTEGVIGSEQHVVTKDWDCGCSDDVEKLDAIHHMLKG